jgi:tetratricopeptide (TPR) repeat protein
LAEIGRTTQALELSEKLIALDPLNPAIFGRKAFAHYFARNYRLSIESSRKALELAPGLTEQTSLIGDCLCLLGRYEEAALQYAKAPPLDPYRITGEAFVAARTGNRAGCQRILDSIQRAFGDPASFQMAQIHAQLGQTDEAFAALEKGRQALDPGLNGLPADPFVDPLRSDRRFNALLKRLDLA